MPPDHSQTNNHASDCPAASSPMLHIEAGVATLTLNRPAQRNSLSDADLQTLLQHLARVEADETVRVLVLAARVQPQRPVFSAGYHMGGFEADASQGPQGFERVCAALARARPVTLCALNGSVYGGATDLALACDFRLGVQGMELRMPAAALGLHYCAGGLQRFVARLGLGAARRIFLLAQPLSADELLRLGYLDALVAPEALPTEVARWCHNLVQLAPLALQGMKQSLQEIALGEHNAAAWREREARTQRSADFAEGRAAFAQRRPAVFLGR